MIPGSRKCLSRVVIRELSSSLSFPKFNKLQQPNENVKIGLFGLSEDRNSSYRRGAALAPNIIREHIHCSANNMTSETGVDLYGGEMGQSIVVDFGNIIPSSSRHEDIYNDVFPVIEQVVHHGLIPIALGGDHSISFPLTRALRHLTKTPFNIVHFDAHPDIYPDFEGNSSSHASPFARICEVGERNNSNAICSKLISIGIRTASAIQLQQIKKYDVSLVEARHLSTAAETIAKFISDESQTYISFDLDCLDPSCAPGVSHREPGGLTTRQAIDIIHSIPGRIIGADLVEYNPKCDIDNLTAGVASKLLKEIIAKAVLSRK